MIRHLTLGTFLLLLHEIRRQLLFFFPPCVGFRCFAGGTGFVGVVLVRLVALHTGAMFAYRAIEDCDILVADWVKPYCPLAILPRALGHALSGVQEFLTQCFIVRSEPLRVSIFLDGRMAEDFSTVRSPAKDLIGGESFVFGGEHS